jgi:hypothetical protein
MSLKRESAGKTWYPSNQGNDQPIARMTDEEYDSIAAEIAASSLQRGADEKYKKFFEEKQRRDAEQRTPSGGSKKKGKRKKKRKTRRKRR